MSNDRLDDMAKALTVADLLQVLASYPPDLPIYIADWNEEYAEDWPLIVEDIRVLDQKPIHEIGSKDLLFEQPRRLCLGARIAETA